MTQSTHDSDPSDVDFSASLHTVSGVVVLRVKGAVDMASRDQFEAAIDDALAQRGRAVIVDLDEVGMFGSVGFAGLLKLYRAVDGATPVASVATRSVTRRPLEVMGVEQLMPLHQTLDEALAAIGD